jgi:hypothetical protein
LHEKRRHPKIDEEAVHAFFERLATALTTQDMLHALWEKEWQERECEKNIHLNGLFFLLVKEF